MLQTEGGMEFFLMLVLCGCLVIRISGQNTTTLPVGLPSLPDAAYCYNASTILKCGSKIEANNSIIRSPVYEYKTWTYPNNTDCSWTFRAPPGYIIKFEFLCFMNIEATSSTTGTCNDDYLQITYAAGGKHTYCGNHNITELSPSPTTGNQANVTFHSDDTGTSKGFVLRIVFEKKYEATCFNTSQIRPCGSTFSSNVTIRSPKDGEIWNYPNNIDCTWNFRAPAGYAWKFQFKCFLSTEASSSGSTCALDDYVRIDGFSYCGTHELDKLTPRISRGSETSVTFHSGSSGSRLGFVLRAEIEKNDEASCFNTSQIRPCGSTFSSNVTIRSPKDGEIWNYPNNIDCTWNFRAPAGYAWKFQFECFLSTETSSSGSTCALDDYVRIDGLSYCGTHELDELTPQISGNETSVTFHSGSSGSSLGFVLRAEIEKNECYNPKTVHPCGSVITTNNTIIRSEMDKDRNYYYPTKLIDCSWMVEAPRGYYLKFEYLCFFSTENSFLHTCDLGDWFLIEPDSGGGIRRCGTFHLSELEPYYTNTSRATLTFHSDYGSSHKGFVLRVVFVSSAQTLSIMPSILVSMILGVTAILY